VLTRGAMWGSIQYKDGITGQPGTVRAPVGVPPVPSGPSANGHPAAQAQGGLSYSAYCSGLYPNLYFARPERQFWPGAGMPVSVVSDNLMPVPATDPRGVNAPLMVPVTLRGQRQVFQPATLVQWPSYP
jgi:hypothetical protein